MDKKEIHNNYCLQVSTLFAELRSSLVILKNNPSHVDSLLSLHRTAHTLKTDALIMKDIALAEAATELEVYCGLCSLESNPLSTQQISIIEDRVMATLTVHRNVDCI